MTTRLLLELTYIAAVIVVPAAVVSLIAAACLRRNAPRLFFCLIILASFVAATAVAVIIRWLQPYRAPSTALHDISSAFVAWGPMFLLPGGLVWFSMRRSTSKHMIPIVAIVGAVLSLPVSFIFGSLAH